ncbi:MAG: pyridoxamine 5'-phosphate oxidase family protein [Pseudomonadales bacterium]|jgi:hypothetical protein|nr:pyridoxamine 5'-phosphate oxidase family protein [Pseudomonadales bacterium]MDP6470318.1 pyridoxamine 5'-phosphate oxidase family protein [Pseudomonadales bacterium]MDP6827224.1 pyridoxamine 5'-phosphate oxidase family protein [Pseudomonadales bacterium]MDP6972473.1 pyridoxamine 5'-phosphate oxidase family protein [Pseudomonadales bacterium]|tara:strand:- start:378 stop:1034 length:657 start_codon:yes stop_codon:yes gene_type:complete
MSGNGTRTRVRRGSGRAQYDPEVVHAALDSQQICHVTWVEGGEPRVIPTLYVREGDALYLHGKREAATLRHLEAGGLCCIAVTAVDGVVVARSGFHCSMNYRSVTLFGHGEKVAGKEHRRLLDLFVDRLIPGHGTAVLPPTSQEVAATAVVRVPIEEVVAKIRSGPPLDDEGDLDLDVWTGVIPCEVVPGAPVPSPDLDAGVEVPGYILALAGVDSRG